MAAEWLNGEDTVIFDLGNGKCAFYEAKHITGKLYAVIFDDFSQGIGAEAVISPAALITEIEPSQAYPGYFESTEEFMHIRWNDEGKSLLRNIKKMSATELLLKLHSLQTWDR